MRGGGQQELRAATARLATAVAVVSVVGERGPAAVTASAVTALSMDPAQLLVCVSTQLEAHALLLRSRRFGVNILGAEDEELAIRFAMPVGARLADVPVWSDRNVPVLRAAIAHFVCDAVERYPGVDHSVFIGEVRACRNDPDRLPLKEFSLASDIPG